MPVASVQYSDVKQSNPCDLLLQKQQQFQLKSKEVAKRQEIHSVFIF